VPASVNSVLEGEGFPVRRAGGADVDFLASLAAHEEVEPFMAAASPREREELQEEVRRSDEEPELHGRFVIEVGREPAGAMAFDVANRRSRIAYLHAIMLEPAHRGRGLATAATRLLVRHLVFDLDYHRGQVEVYGFNEAALRHFERAGFRREGVRRRAYRRHGAWVDGILFGLIREDIEIGEWQPTRRAGIRHAVVTAPARFRVSHARFSPVRLKVGGGTGCPG
jgi:RimJ/RimL family protein N-acetyltransferase